MRPKLKISNLISLQDARSSAAVGFDFIGFNLIRGANQKVSVSMAWNIIQWLSGPEIVLELDKSSMPELDDAANTFEFPHVSLPWEDWSPGTDLKGKDVILRGDHSLTPDQVGTLLEQMESLGVSGLIELSLPGIAEVKAYKPHLGHCLIHLPQLEMVEDLIQQNDLIPGGLSFYDEVQEEPGVLDYERIDEFLELFEEVFEEED